MGSWNKQRDFEVLKGKTLAEVTGLEDGNDSVTFVCSDGTKYVMYHMQDCCESVAIESVVGDVSDLIGSEILVAEEVVSENPPEDHVSDGYDHETWTFYKLATLKGYVDIRWYGSSNGYYSESVDFFEE